MAQLTGRSPAAATAARSGQRANPAGDTVSRPGSALTALLTAVAVSLAACGDGSALDEQLERAYRANNRGVALLEQFDYEQAAAAFREALATEESLSIAHLNLSLALLYAQDLEGALASANEAARLLPDAPQPHYVIGLIERAQSYRSAQQHRMQELLARLDDHDRRAATQTAAIERREAESAELLRLAEPHDGKVYYNGVDLFSLPSDRMNKLREEMQIIFQDPYSSLNPRMTIGSAIMEPMVVHKLHGSDAERKEKVLDLLRKVNLRPEHFNRYPHEFSGGQRQRICIARALALNPRFIICDESVSALDVSVQAQILKLIKDIQQRLGLAILFVTHDLRVAAQICDKIAVMQRGRIVEAGPTAALFAAPQHDYTRQLLAAVPGGERFGR